MWSVLLAASGWKLVTISSSCDTEFWETDVSPADVARSLTRVRMRKGKCVKDILTQHQIVSLAGQRFCSCHGTKFATLTLPNLPCYLQPLSGTHEWWWLARTNLANSIVTHLLMVHAALSDTIASTHQTIWPCNETRNCWTWWRSTVWLLHHLEGAFNGRFRLGCKREILNFAREAAV